MLTMGQSFRGILKPASTAAVVPAPNHSSGRVRTYGLGTLSASPIWRVVTHRMGVNTMLRKTRLIVLGLSAATLLANAGAFAQSGDSFSSNGGLPAAPSGGFVPTAPSVNGLSSQQAAAVQRAYQQEVARFRQQQAVVQNAYQQEVARFQQQAQRAYQQQYTPQTYNPAFGRPNSPVYNPAFGRPNGFSPQRAPYNIPFYDHASAEQQALMTAPTRSGIQQFNDLRSFLGNAGSRQYGKVIYQQLKNPLRAY